MTTVNNLRKTLDTKKWEILQNGTPVGTATGQNVVACDHVKQMALYVFSQTFVMLYDVENDANSWLTSPSYPQTFGAGSAVCAVPYSLGTQTSGSSLTATGGTTSTITTNQTLRRDLRGWPIYIMEGPNAGSLLTITRSTVGSNAVITVPTQASAFTNATKFRLMTPKWYYLAASTSTSTKFGFYDWATNTWTEASSTGLPTTFGTDAWLTPTPSWAGTDFVPIKTGTATSATATTLVNSGKTWTTSQWVNFQVRITGGTGAGQIRTITANDATSLTVSTWTTTPDSTSTYSIEGNDDFIYLMGNNAVTLYRYSLNGNSWTTLSPSVARSAAPNTGVNGYWISQSSDSVWSDESSIINGRRIYSFRGGTTTDIDYYDIPSNSWTSSITYPSSFWEYTGSGGGGPQNVSALIDNKIYILSRLKNIMIFDPVTSDFIPWVNYPQLTDPQFSTTSTVSRSAFTAYYKDGGTKINYFYMIHPSNGYLMRCMVI